MTTVDEHTGTQATYRTVTKLVQGLPVWHQPWWLDATAGSDGWDAVMVSKGSSIAAVLPYTKRRRNGFTVLTQPPLTQSLGPWFTGEHKPKLSEQHRLLAALMEQLPAAHGYRQNWMPELNNWLPFYWAGYSQSTRYTYRLDLSDNTDALWQQMEGRCRTAIRKGTSQSNLTVGTSRDVDDFWQLIAHVFSRHGQDVPYSRALVDQILRAGTAQKALTMYVARDAAGIAHAGAIVIHDQLRSYYILGGTSEEHRDSGGMNVALWQAILEAHARGHRIFDFEGSMIGPIESFFRSFGSRQTPYFRVWKHHHPVLRQFMRLRGQ